MRIMRKTPGPKVRAALDDLYNSYMWAMDLSASDAYADFFWEDAIFREDQKDGSTVEFRGRQAIKEYVLGYHGKPDWPGHQHRETTRIYFPDSRGRKNHWEVQSYWFTTEFDVPSHSGEVKSVGYYRDTVSKRNGVWKWSRRWVAPWKPGALPEYR